MDKKALFELFKSFARFIWFGVLGLVVVFLTSLTTDEALLAATWTILDVAVPIGVWIVAGVGFGIKALDRYIHKSKSKIKGLAPSILQK